MARPSPSACAHRTLTATRRASALAELQGGRITRAQLMRCGLSESQVGRWLRGGRIYRVGDGVYALGHSAESESTPLFEALLRAGSGAALSHPSCLWWRDLIRFAPPVVHVSAPGRCRSGRGVVIHHPGTIEREWHRGIPVVPLAQALLDSASMISFAGMRRALAIADRQALMSVEEIEAVARSGRRGCATIKKAFAMHMPQLADTRSPLEDRFLFFCERWRIELPRPNYEIAGYEVDAVWPDLFLAVELDGREEHGTPAAVVRDRRRELAIRGAGFELIRYGSEQIDHNPSATAEDLRAALKRASCASGRRLEGAHSGY